MNLWFNLIILFEQKFKYFLSFRKLSSLFSFSRRQKQTFFAKWKEFKAFWSVMFHFIDSYVTNMSILWTHHSGTLTLVAFLPDLTNCLSWINRRSVTDRQPLLTFDLLLMTSLEGSLRFRFVWSRKKHFEALNISALSLESDHKWAIRKCIKLEKLSGQLLGGLRTIEKQKIPGSHLNQ